MARTVASGREGDTARRSHATPPLKEATPVELGDPLLHRRGPSQRPVEVPADVVDVFQPHRDAHQIRGDPGCCLLLVRQLLVRCATRVDDQCLASPILARCEISRNSSINLAPVSLPPLTPNVKIALAPRGRYRAARSR